MLVKFCPSQCLLPPFLDCTWVPRFAVRKALRRKARAKRYSSAEVLSDYTCVNLVSAPIPAVSSGLRGCKEGCEVFHMEDSQLLNHCFIESVIPHPHPVNNPLPESMTSPLTTLFLISAFRYQDVVPTSSRMVALKPPASSTTCVCHHFPWLQYTWRWPLISRPKIFSSSDVTQPYPQHSCTITHTGIFFFFLIHNRFASLALLISSLFSVCPLVLPYFPTHVQAILILFAPYPGWPSWNEQSCQ